MCRLAGLSASAVIALGVFYLVFSLPAWVEGSDQHLLGWSWVTTPLGYLAGGAVFLWIEVPVTALLYLICGGAFED
ncbi:MAG TPA: hypothetical protein VFE82_12085 [Ramlibacter sp.]|uniref:hypothetical protein n=1 Tax=Ramlibacter sp. TaxID=1917967 RepID=UPI002D2B7FB3|nr:hypothetical protein [Ramlibacter sp.]HZY19211.1 hypothetical protein [Ramlibacter sp.]